MLLRIILGILAIGLGFVMVWKTNWFLENFGIIAWAEQHLGAEGGSRIFYKLLGILIIILAFMLMTGLLQKLLLSIFTFNLGP